MLEWLSCRGRLLRSRWFICFCAGVLTLTCGCPYAGIPEALTPYDLQNDLDGDGSLETARSVSWNGDAGTAVGGISVDPANMLAIRSFLGSEVIGVNMPPSSEVDVFSLGTLDTGDQISVSVTSLMQQIVNLTPLAQADVIRNVTGQSVFMVDSHSEIVGYPAAAPVPVDGTGEYFLVVESFVPGDYVFNVNRIRGEAPRPPRRGMLLLQFGGCDSDLNFLDPKGQVIKISDLPPFQLEDARPDLAGQTMRFEQTVRQFVESIYADYDVTVTLDAAQAQAADHYDTMVFTTPSASDLGFSQQANWTTLGVEPTIDVEDQGSQTGIVFILAYEESRYLDFNSYAAFWSSVAAHEYGHAVGLWHVSQDSKDLMTPSLGGPGESRRLKTLVPATKEEQRSCPAIRLIQNPDRYLSRVLGRRDPGQAESVREGARELLPDFGD